MQSINTWSADDAAIEFRKMLEEVRNKGAVKIESIEHEVFVCLDDQNDQEKDRQERIRKLKRRLGKGIYIRQDNCKYIFVRHRRHVYVYYRIGEGPRAVYGERKYKFENVQIGEDSIEFGDWIWMSSTSMQALTDYPVEWPEIEAVRDRVNMIDTMVNNGTFEDYNNIPLTIDLLED